MTSEGPYQPGYPPGSEGYPPQGDSAVHPGPDRPSGYPAEPDAFAAPPVSPATPAGVPAQARAAVRMPAELRIEPPTGGDPDDRAGDGGDFASDGSISGGFHAGGRGQVYGRPSAPAAYGTPSSPATYGTPAGQRPSSVYGTPAEPPAPKPAAIPMPTEEASTGAPPSRVYGQPPEQPGYESRSSWHDDAPGSPAQTPYPDRLHSDRPHLPQQRGGSTWLADDQPADAGGAMSANQMPANQMSANQMSASGPAGSPVVRAPGVYGRPVEAPPAGPQPLYGGGAPIGGQVDEPSQRGMARPQPESFDSPPFDSPPFDSPPRDSPRMGLARVEPMQRADPAPPAWGEQLAAGPRQGTAGGTEAVVRPGQAGGMLDGPPRSLTGDRVPEWMSQPLADPPPATGGKRSWKAIGYIAIALLVVALGAGALYYTSRPNAPSFKVGSCVQQSGDSAVEVSCSAPHAFKVVSRVADATRCTDKSQPHIKLSNTEAATSVVCLSPAN